MTVTASTTAASTATASTTPASTAAVSPVLALVQPVRRTHVVDIGANPIDGDPRTGTCCGPACAV